MNKDLSHNICRQFAKYVSFNVLSMLGLSCYIFADTLFVANGVGSDGLTALNLALPAFSLMNGLGLMIGMGAATLYSAFRGAGNQEKANSAFTNALILGGFFAVIIFILGIFFSDNIALFLGSDQQLLPMVSIYIKVLLCFSPAFILNNIIVFFIRNDNAPRLAMIAMLVSSLSNIVLDYVFVFPLQMGIFGAVLATGFSPLVSLIILSTRFLKKRTSFKLIKIHFSIKPLIRIITIGVPSFITEISSGIVIMVFNYTLLEFAGNVGVAAYGVIANIALIAVSIFTGVAQGTQPISSYNFGVNNFRNIRKVAVMGIFVSVVLGAIMYIVSSIFTGNIVQIFNSENNSQLQEIAEYGVRLYFTSFIFMGINMLVSVHFASVQKPMPSFLVSILRGIALVVPFTIILPRFMGITGVWLAVPFTEIITAIVSIIMLILWSKSVRKTFEYIY